MLLTRTVAPAAPAYSLDEVRELLRLTFTDDDSMLTALLDAAEEAVEEMTGRSLITQTWAITLPALASDAKVMLERPPVLAITSVSYFDGQNAQQTLDAATYRLVKDGDRAMVRPVDGNRWPSMYDREDAVTITYTAGFGASYAAIPPALRTAMAILADHWFHRKETEDGERSIPPSVGNLVGLHRMGFVAA
jgi:uncharacterized phiE125 gp8 family phage protein